MRTLPLALIAALTACTPRPAPTLTSENLGGVDAAGGTCSCATFGNPRNRGVLQEPALVELSGLVASRVHQGVLYAHNDSGDSARFFALSTTGVPLGQFVLSGATASDWEDIARGPCDGGTCLYLGDIGDNAQARGQYAVYRVAEPQQLPGGSVDVAWERLAFVYPQGESHNAETLLADPASGRLYVVTKNSAGPSVVFRFPLPPDPNGTNTLEQVTVLDLPASGDQPVTGGDVSPCGDALLLRMYNRLVVKRRDLEQPFETVFDAAPTTVPSANEPQGEAVAFAPDGQGYFTSSEKLVADVPVYESLCL